ncbi:O-succinylhomoserine sulfhydrylase [Aliifodinibius salicampi]|uniref:O-succinylhomoserine sulfhydrylase n=1 Tax=Fodinibius salicampi TaxID=1920655 RepID=A0ABT3PZZ9_9BACT|nr:O-succinylhomoserine sulfhydrylase [Fodinibius salicampi]MCW9713409.1 O-succinylhomoserine sulfhydrylase [Fodinibius salicampi]
MSEQQAETKSIRTQTERTEQREHSTPLFMTSSFVFDSAEHARALFAREVDGNVYSRYSNPNTNEFVEKMCRLEGAEDGVSTASGMSAIFSSLAALLEQGDHILACRSLFGSSHQILNEILPKWGIDYSYGNIDQPEQWEQYIQDNTKVLFLETPSNPGLDLIDLEWAGELAEAHNLILIVDNCFATPYLQKPIEYGTDIVLHSATKFIDGQGRGIGGVIVGKEEYIEDISFFCRHSGPALSPFNAWMFSKSLETLPVRMDRHCDNALALAQFLEEQSTVEWVKYPFLPSHPQYKLAQKQMKKGGGVVAFNIEGGYDAAKQFLDKLNTLSLSANLGDTRTIATHPASTTHSKLTEEERAVVNITPGMVRIAVGLEAIEDIQQDIDQALH